MRNRPGFAGVEFDKLCRNYSIIIFYFLLLEFMIMEFCTICECSIERGVENDLVMPTCDDCAEFEMEDEYDGQPDEMQEWADFDPDC